MSRHTRFDCSILASPPTRGEDANCFEERRLFRSFHSRFRCSMHHGTRGMKILTHQVAGLIDRLTGVGRELLGVGLRAGHLSFCRRHRISRCVSIHRAFVCSESHRSSTTLDEYQSCPSMDDSFLLRNVIFYIHVLPVRTSPSFTHNLLISRLTAPSGSKSSRGVQ